MIPLAMQNVLISFRLLEANALFVQKRSSFPKHAAGKGQKGKPIRFTLDFMGNGIVYSLVLLLGSRGGRYKTHQREIQKRN